MNLPNRLTLLRMLLIPLFIGCFYLPWTCWPHIAAAVFIVAYITDILDGYLARRMNIVTDFGKLMDPIADKLLTASALIMLTAQGSMSPIPAFIIIAREFVISGFRLVNASRGRVIAAGWIGKWKTVTQCISIVLLLFHDYIMEYLGFPLDKIILWISVILAVWSAIDYICRNRSAVNTEQGSK